MALPSTSIAITAGSGETVATETVSSKKYQAFMQAGADGHILDSKPVYYFRIANQVHVAAASTIHWDLFNADAALLVRVVSIMQLPDVITAVTGVATNWQLERTTAVGTGGSAQTAWLPDLSQTGLDADITCRSKPTGGATSGILLNAYTVHSEETNAATQMLHMMMLGGVADLVPEPLASSGAGILLRQNQGIKCVQTTNSSAGNTAWLIGFTVQ